MTANKYQPGIIIEVKPYRTLLDGTINLVTINDGYKITLARPPVKTTDISKLERLMIGTNFLDY